MPYKAILTTYRGATYSKPSRIQAFDGDHRVYVNCDPTLSPDENNHAAMLKLVNTKWGTKDTVGHGKYTMEHFAWGHTNAGRAYVLIGHPRDDKPVEQPKGMAYGIII